MEIDQLPFTIVRLDILAPAENKRCMQAFISWNAAGGAWESGEEFLSIPAPEVSEEFKDVMTIRNLFHRMFLGNFLSPSVESQITAGLPTI